MTTPGILDLGDTVPILQIGVADSRVEVPNPATWDVARWDGLDTVWAGSVPYWLDVSCHVIEAESYRGRQRIADRWDPGTLTVMVSNADGWADVLAAPAAPAVLAIRPGRPIRYGVAIDGAEVWLWRGFIDRQSAGYPGNLAAVDTVTFEAVDALGESGRSRLPGLAGVVGAGETVTQRLHRILTAAKWPNTARRLDQSTTVTTSTNLSGRASDLLTAAADTAGGAVFGDLDGNVRFRHRDWQAWTPGTPADAEVGNLAGVVCPTMVDVEFGRGDATTRAVVNYSGGVAVTADDVAAQTLYGVETTPELTDLVTDNPVQLQLLADRLLRINGTSTMPRIAGMLFQPRAETLAMRQVIAAADPGRPTRWHVRLERDGRPVADRQLFVTSVRHTITAAAWRCEVTCDDAAPWQAAGGRWDGSYWDFATWAEPLTAAVADLLDTLEAV